MAAPAETPLRLPEASGRSQKNRPTAFAARAAFAALAGERHHVPIPSNPETEGVGTFPAQVCSGRCW